MQRNIKELKMDTSRYRRGSCGYSKGKGYWTVLRCLPKK